MVCVCGDGVCVCGDGGVSYVDEGGVDVVRVLLTPLHRDDHSVELI